MSQPQLNRAQPKRLWAAPALACFLFSLTLVAGCSEDKLRLVGTVERKTLELAAPISEIITEMKVEVGSRVAAEQVVVQLDTEVAAAELRAAEAARDAAQAAVTETRGEFSRVERLRRTGVKPQQALDAARRQRDEALAQLASFEARVVQASRRLADLTIRTLSSGTVDQLPYEVGERAPAGGVVAVVLSDANPWVRVWLPARAVARLAPGHPATISIEGLDQDLPGRLLDIAREPEFTPHYALTERESAHLVYEARIELLEAPADLPPGLPARVHLDTDPQEADG